MKVILVVEGRNKVLFIDGDNVEVLRKDFYEMCKHDPVLKLRIQTHYPTFVSYNETYKMELEIEMEETLKDGQCVRVHFVPYAANDTDEDTRKSSAKSGNTSNSSSTSELDYLKSIGMRFSTKEKDNTTATNNGNPPASTSNRANSRLAKGANLPTTSSKRNTRRTITNGNNSDDEPNDYLKASEDARKENLSALKEMNIKTPIKRIILKPKKRKQQQKNGDENTMPAPSRSQPLRAVKSRKIIEDFEELTNEDDPAVEEVSYEQAPLLENIEEENQRALKRTQRGNTNRKKPQKRRRLIGEIITMKTPLPPFPDKLKESIAKGLVYSEQAHTQRMNDFLKAHVRNITKDSYPFNSEYEVLKTQVVSRLRTQNISNISVYEENLRRSLSASLRNDRNWEINKKPKYLAAKFMLELAHNADVPNPMVTVAINASDADQILKNPVRNKETVKSALVAAAKITTDTIQKESLECAMDTYPYLKEADLLMQDFANKVESSLEQFEQNFENAMLPLVSLLQDIQSPEDELAKAKLVQKINEYFEPKEPNFFPCFQMCDVSITSNEVLQNIPNGQAPALIFTVNDKDLVSAIVVFNQKPLYTITTPRTYECIVLLLAIYFVYNIKYPNVYQKILVTLEHIILGENRISKIAKEVKSFFRKFFEAKKLCV